MKRNWPSILIDAGLRGLSCVDVAKEQGCDRSSVAHAASRYAVRLANLPGQHNGKRGGPRAKDKAERRDKRKAAKFTALFAAAPKGETLTAFCIRAGVGTDAAQRWAKRLGHTFEPSPASRRTAGGRPGR